MGVRVTPELDTINSIPIKADSGVEREPDVAFDGENFVVVWSEGFIAEYKVYAARVTTDGVVLDSGIPFGIDAFCEYGPNIDFDGNRYLAIWYTYNYPPHGVWGRFLNTEGKPVGDEILIRSFSSSYMFNPDIIFGGNNYLVVWNEPSVSGNEDIYGQLVSTSGGLIGGVIPIATDSAYQFDPRISFCDSNYLVVWNQNSKICGQWISADGTLIGENFEISDSISANRSSPDIAIGTTNCLAVWMEYHGTSFDIYGNLDILTGIKEFSELIRGYNYTTTIVSGQLSLPENKKCEIFDIAGRKRQLHNLAPGIYFIKVNGQIVQKIVKIR